ncbi:MAG: hypothetical protein JWN32_498 [Solirubrobacterales bacterium]|nr:hypothetical protein [Solirubrobacterales bacterium]
MSGPVGAARVLSAGTAAMGEDQGRGPGGAASSSGPGSLRSTLTPSGVTYGRRYWTLPRFRKSAGSFGTAITASFGISRLIDLSCACLVFTLSPYRRGRPGTAFRVRRTRCHHAAMSLPAAPPQATRAEVAFEAADKLLSEWAAGGRVRSVRHLAALRAAAADVVMEADELDEQERDRCAEREDRRANASFWRERMPALAESMLTPQNERHSANDIASMAAEIGVNLDRIPDWPSLAKEGRVAAPAYVAPTHLIRSTGRLHDDLGVHPLKPIPEQRIAAATKEPGDAGKRARLAVRLLAMSRRSGSR